MSSFIGTRASIDGEIQMNTRAFCSIFQLVVIAAGIAGCVTVPPPPPQAEAQANREEQKQAQAALATPSTKHLKQKIAIGRFTNETRYGRTFLRDDQADPLGKQASDMLGTRLVDSGAFLVFERPDLNKVKGEQITLGQSDLIGVDTLILGSVTEFGRTTTGESGFLSSTKKQTAHAKVEIRLVDVRTGQDFFSATGSGEANSTVGDIAGFGARADYDATLNDKAIGAAISDVMNSLVSKISERPWRTAILKIDGSTIFVSGGAHQGLKVGDTLRLMRAGDTIKSPQTGFNIDLPPIEVGRVRVTQLFGDSETNEGAVTELTQGSLPSASTTGIFVMEVGGGPS